MATESYVIVNDSGLKINKQYTVSSVDTKFEAELGVVHEQYNYQPPTGAMQEGVEYPVLTVNTDVKSQFQNIEGESTTMKTSSAYGNINLLNKNTYYIHSNLISADGYVSNDFEGVNDAVINAIETKLANANNEMNIVTKGSISANKINVGYVSALSPGLDVESGFAKIDGGNSMTGTQIITNQVTGASNDMTTTINSNGLFIDGSYVTNTSKYYPLAVTVSDAPAPSGSNYTQVGIVCGVDPDATRLCGLISFQQVEFI